MPSAAPKQSPKRRLLSPSQRLQRLSRKWIKRLRLQNFQKIEVRLSPKSEMDNSLGWAQWSPEYRYATVRILDPTENEDITADEYDAFMEETLVHEFLHLLLEGHKTMESVTQTYDPAHEAALNILAEALVS